MLWVTLGQIFLRVIYLRGLLAWEWNGGGGKDKQLSISVRKESGISISRISKVSQKVDHIFCWTYLRLFCDLYLYFCILILFFHTTSCLLRQKFQSARLSLLHLYPWKSYSCCVSLYLTAIEGMMKKNEAHHHCVFWAVPHGKCTCVSWHEHLMNVSYR